MKTAKVYIYGTLVALPFIGLAYYWLHPPQCPLDFTQEQIDASRCVVGANIGGTPLFIIVSMAIWLAAIWLAGRFVTKRKGR